MESLQNERPRVHSNYLGQDGEHSLPLGALAAATTTVHEAMRLFLTTHSIYSLTRMDHAAYNVSNKRG